MSELIVPSRFCGPPSSGNGGWTAGALAALLSPHAEGEWPTIEVTLRQPPPLDQPMPVSDGTASDASGAPVAQARLVDGEPTAPTYVDAADAEAASARYPGLVEHPFPTCFSCGTAREDGLRIFPGPTGDHSVAATWTPRADLISDYHVYEDPQPCASLASTWSAIDCAGGWACDFGPRLMVLGRMTARVHALPELGRRHVVVGEKREQSGRKSVAATGLYTEDGTLVAAAEQVWISVESADFA